MIPLVISLKLLFVIVGLTCWGFATFGIGGKINLVAAGLFLIGCAILLIR